MSEKHTIESVLASVVRCVETFDKSIEDYCNQLKELEVEHRNDPEAQSRLAGLKVKLAWLKEECDFLTDRAHR